jgi:hypothetical protein
VRHSPSEFVQVFEGFVMRRSLVRPFGPAVFSAFLALSLAGAAIAEDAEFENVETEGSQFAPAGSGPDASPIAHSLNTVPEDDLGPQSPQGPNSRLVQALLNARPNEDLVICVAGCFSDRDRVVYAQPIEKPVPARQTSSKAPSADSREPAVLNGASDGTKGAGQGPAE